MAALSKLPSPPGWDPPTLAPSSAILALVSLSVAGIVAGSIRLDRPPHCSRWMR